MAPPSGHRTLADGLPSGHADRLSQASGSVVIFHILLHFLVPAAVARLAFPRRWLYSFLIMAATMVVDLDHLLANPIYDPRRCSIGFHPLHTALPLLLYGVLCCFPRTRLIGLGLIIHMGLDGVDCL